jgi:hypothetical protein
MTPATAERFHKGHMRTLRWLALRAEHLGWFTRKRLGDAIREVRPRVGSAPVKRDEELEASCSLPLAHRRPRRTLPLAFIHRARSAESTLFMGAFVVPPRGFEPRFPP